MSKDFKQGVTIAIISMVITGIALFFIFKHYEII